MNLELRLDCPAMTLLQRAGLAGLWMTLVELQKDYPTKDSRPGYLDWILSDDGINITWCGEDLIVFDWLFNQSFQLDRKGMINLAGLRSVQTTVESRLATHKGITRTFLQLNKFVSSNGTGSKFVQIDGFSIEVKYKKVKRYAHQDYAKSLCDKEGFLRKEPIGVVSWLYPGQTVRHYAYESHTKFQDSTELAFALVFAPVACLYFVLMNRTQGGKEQYALVIPEIVNLRSYYENRKQIKQLSYKDFCVFGLGDAGLRGIIHQLGESLSDVVQTQRCQVLLFSEAPWVQHQSVRTKVLDLCINYVSLSNYLIFLDFFAQIKVCEKTGEKLNFFHVSIGKLITDNLARNQPWWLNLFRYSQGEERLPHIQENREILIHMSRKVKRDSRSEELFIQACHETFKRIYAKIYDRTQVGEMAPIERKNQQLLYRLRLCRSEASFRRFLCFFFAEATPNSVVAENEVELRPIFSGMIDWEIVRDLFLFAMISYPKAGNLLEENSPNKE